ncbi:DNA polymerase III alpha subunit [Devosia sp. UYZn731]|uniref:hypothetical protein n=1 Tax=Devosia sp. UYZn731 TaxID=3156345 RepID=UPI003394275A
MNNVTYHAPHRHWLQNVLTCIRLGITLDRTGRRLDAAGVNHLKPPEDMALLFVHCPDAIDETARLSRVHFSLDQLRYNYPKRPSTLGRTKGRYNDGE